MNRVQTCCACLLALLCFTTLHLACKGSSAPPRIVIEDIWSRPVLIDVDLSSRGAAKVEEQPWSSNGVVYLRIRNDGGTSDRLLAAKSTVCKATEIHITVVEGEVMSMHRLHEGLEIAAGAVAEFEPGAAHLMLLGLTRSLKPGDRFEVTLQFEKSGQMTVVSQVQKP
ncbi:MAG: copper chaperone PCu(A)C [bacterium]